MPLKPPHEYRIDRATKQMVITGEHPTLRFAAAEVHQVATAPDGSKIYEANPDAHPPITYQEGKFYLDDQTVVPVRDVPRYIVDQVRAYERRTIDEPKPPARLSFTLEEAETYARTGKLPTPAPAARRAARPKRRKATRRGAAKRTRPAAAVAAEPEAAVEG